MSTFRPVTLLTLAVLVALLTACGAADTTRSSSDPPTTVPTSGGAPSTTPPTASAKPEADASHIVLPTYGLKLALPPGWTQQHEGDSVLAFSASGKSGMLVYATKVSAVEEVVPLLHMVDDKLGVFVQVGLGEKWVSKSGLRFSRNQTSLKTKRGENAVSTTLLGAAPADRESAAGVIAVAVEGDGDAKTAIDAALETIAPL